MSSFALATNDEMGFNSSGTKSGADIILIDWLIVEQENREQESRSHCRDRCSSKVEIKDDGNLNLIFGLNYLRFRPRHQLVPHTSLVDCAHSLPRVIGYSRLFVLASFKTKPI